MKTRKILALILAVVMVAGLPIQAGASTWNPSTWVYDWPAGYFQGMSDVGGILYWQRSRDSEFPSWTFNTTEVDHYTMTFNGTLRSPLNMGQGGLLFLSDVAVGMFAPFVTVNAHGIASAVSLVGTITDVSVGGATGFNVSRHAPDGGWALRAAELIGLAGNQQIGPNGSSGGVVAPVGQINGAAYTGADVIAAAGTTGSGLIADLSRTAAAPGAVFRGTQLGDLIVNQPDAWSATNTGVTPTSLTPNAANLARTEGTLFVGAPTTGNGRIPYGFIGDRRVTISVRIAGDAAADWARSNPGEELENLRLEINVLLNPGVPRLDTASTHQNNGQWATPAQASIEFPARTPVTTVRRWSNRAFAFTNYNTIVGEPATPWLVNFTTEEMRQIAAAARDTGASLRVTANIRIHATNAWGFPAGVIFRMRVGKIWGADQIVNQLQWMVGVPGSTPNQIVFDIPPDILMDARFDWNLAWLHFQVFTGGTGWGGGGQDIYTTGFGGWSGDVFIGEISFDVVEGRDGPIVPEGYIKGNLSRSGTLMAFDALIALQIAVGLLPASASDIIIGDMNGDGVITAIDALMILELVVAS
jgi:hypothetical protein